MSQAREERLVDEVVDTARGFIDTTQQERHDECEEAVNDVLQCVRRVAPQRKVHLFEFKSEDRVLTNSSFCGCEVNQGRLEKSRY